MEGFWLLTGITSLLVLLGIVESVRHRRHLQRIPTRVHVNGTRGKSSVTRLIAAGLRAGGIRTCAKTTGTLARMILPDGSEFPVFRPSRPNVIEQIRILATAAHYNAQVMVIECMAVQPYLQTMSELLLVRATHGVITNARADHLEVMGPTEDDVARALCGMVPRRGKLFTAEQRHLAMLEYAAKDRGSTLHPTTRSDVEAISEEDLAGFKYVEHAENVALALAVCQDLGVDRATALRGMWEARPDPGVMTVHELDFFGRRIIFVNGFAANDPESTERIWNIANDRYPEVKRRIAMFNCRSDRPDRSQQLGRSCVEWRPADRYVLIGTGTYLFARAAADEGMNMLQLVFLEDRRVEEIFEAVVDLAGESALIMGMGNIGGHGLEIVRYFRNRSIYSEAW